MILQKSQECSHLMIKQSQEFALKLKTKSSSEFFFCFLKSCQIKILSNLLFKAKFLTNSNFLAKKNLALTFSKISYPVLKFLFASYNFFFQRSTQRLFPASGFLFSNLSFFIQHLFSFETTDTLFLFSRDFRQSALKLNRSAGYGTGQRWL